MFGGRSADYERKKITEAKRQRAKAAAAAELGPLPPVADPARRACAMTDPEFFYQTYFPRRFGLPFSDDHRELIAELETTMRAGGLKAFAMPRGTGKSSLSECAAIRAVLFGLRQFVVVVGASQDAGNEMLASIKGEFEGNDLLLADFPEVCYPIQALKGITQRCNSQTCGGERTRIQWKGATIVLPTVQGSIASGAILSVRGITGRIRGMKFLRPDGQSVRPDFAIVDDPQTDQSANSLTQCRARMKTLAGSILGLAGPGRKMAVIVPCTVIRRGDLADELLDRDRNPHWHGYRTRMVRSWPTDEALWSEYAEIRRDDLRNGGRGEHATEFYRARRAKMDAGGEVAWPARHNGDELSGIQHAMNLRIDNPETFDAEYQNEPRAESLGDDAQLDPEKLAAKLNGLSFSEAPLATQTITAFVDVQKRLLYFAVVGWAKDFSGAILSYGTWPDQQSSYFRYREARHTIAKRFPNALLPGQLRGALDALFDDLAARVWTRQDGVILRLNLALVDAGYQDDAIYRFCRESKHAALVLPSKGFGLGPQKKPMTEWKRGEGALIGTHWTVGRVENQRAVRLVSFDSFFWKSAVRRGLAAALGDPQSIDFNGPHGKQPHRHLAEHLTSEFSKRTEGAGRVVDVWSQKPDHPDNHWWDCLVGSAVGASICGCDPLGRVTPAKRKRKGARISVL